MSGESHKLTCTYSGISTSSDELDQKGFCSGSVHNLQVYLQMNNLNTEDSAVYYCARDKVTQETAAPNKNRPSRYFTVKKLDNSELQCLLGCIAKGFSPSSHTFKWTDASGKALTDFVQYPAVQSGGTYTGVSQLRVAKNVWENSKSFSCSVDHPGGEHQHVLLSHCFSPLSEPLTVTLNPPSVKKVFIDNQAVLDCVISGTDQDTVSGTNITWHINGDKQTAHIDLKPIESKGNLNSRVSTLTIDQTRWTNVNKVQCSAMKRGEDTPVIQDLSFNKGSEAPSVSVHILPEEDTREKEIVTLVCLVVSPSLCDVYIIWKVNSGDYQEGVTSPPQKTQKGNYSVTSVFTTTKKEWEGNSVFTCAVKHLGSDNNTTPQGRSAGFALSCTDNFEDEFSSLWSTTSSFIILFLLSLTYSTVLSLVKMKQ
uniref:Ig-like domain-containing protein n=1 Tax=Oncorhynchus kisutch TaxID=8019 RepID=A0A8C7KAC6_ONCKI